MKKKKRFIVLKWLGLSPKASDLPLNRWQKK